MAPVYKLGSCTALARSAVPACCLHARTTLAACLIKWDYL